MRRSSAWGSGPLRLRARKDAGWDEHQGFYVPPDAPHEFIATATSTAIVYVEAESAEAAQQRRTLDPRIVDTLALIRTRLDQPMRLSTLARTLNMSPSWLSHQFTKQVGMPLRRYVLWQRLWRAVEAALRGSTLTEAAHAAGFSDSSHLSRTFRGTFGVAPSFLFGRRDQVFVCFADA